MGNIALGILFMSFRLMLIIFLHPPFFSIEAYKLLTSFKSFSDELIQPYQTCVAMFPWYLSVRLCTLSQGTKNARPCITGHPVSSHCKGLVAPDRVLRARHPPHRGAVRQ